MLATGDQSQRLELSAHTNIYDIIRASFHLDAPQKFPRFSLGPTFDINFVQANIFFDV